MIKTVFALAFCTVACVALAADGIPTPADNTTSVLASAPAQTQTTSQPVAVAAVAAPACCETAKEVRLGPWQARRLSRQAERQEARDCRDCCKGKCDCKDECKPTALVVTRTRPACNCCK